ncbi:MAG: glycosyltransferase family 2 protein [Candidatus Methanomethyliaceae archaeon]
MTTLADSVLPESCFVVVPAFNEAPRIGRTLESLLQVARSVVVVDDGSADNTAEVALNYPVWVLRHPVNLGAGAATQTGISFALRQGAEYVATFDADGQHRAQDLPKLMQILLNNKANIVFGSRFLGKAIDMPFHRRVMLKVASAAVWVLCGIWVTDVTTGLRLMDAKAARMIKITMNRFEHPIDLLHQVRVKKLRFAEGPATILYSADSLRKGQRTSDVFRLALQIIAERVMR